MAALEQETVEYQDLWKNIVALRAILYQAAKDWLNTFKGGDEASNVRRETLRPSKQLRSALARL